MGVGMTKQIGKNKKKLLVVLKNMVKAIKNSDEVTRFEIASSCETEEVPTEYWNTIAPTGYINMEIKIRFLDGSFKI